jgi:imidazole glycerol-phosphate synthase subunit HisH
MSKIAIFDYGSGNLFSLKSALERNGAKKVLIINNMESIKSFDGLVLPGVGNFDPAIKSIEGYKRLFVRSVEMGMPILGICLGMEMLFDHSEEGILAGLKILNGHVVMLNKKNVKIPHIGWNNLEIKKKDSKLLKHIKDGAWVYFVHSYYAIPENKSIVTADSTYGNIIPAVIENNNLFGTQFHPEKSGSIGAIIIKNFLSICSGKTN